MNYELTVWCRRNGVSCDAGTHDQGDFASDALAETALRKSAQGLLKYYDEIGCTILCGSRVVAKWTLRR